ncbi:MAG: hypothetical protein Q4G67_09215 [Actinomycetia bacterium]|nr:hypothetical protein [Actinomycetes bacterium]
MRMTIGVLGASGGLGASTLTAAIASVGVRLLEADQAVAVDLDPRGHLDTTMCLEHLDGVRWSDLEPRHAVDLALTPQLTVADLPGDDGIHVLAGRGADLPDWRRVAQTLDVLTPRVDVTAVDCGWRPHGSVLSRLDLLIVLTRLDARGMADAAGLDDRLGLGRTQVALVARGDVSRSQGQAAGRSLRLPFLTTLADDQRIGRDAARGVPPGEGVSALDDVVAEVVTAAESSWLAELMDTERRTARGA